MKMKNRVLAVLALALLMINMAPVRKAEAAITSDGSYYPDVSDIKWGDYLDELQTAISECDLFWVSYELNNYVYGFIDSDKYDDARYVWSSTSGYRLNCNYYFVVDELTLSVESFWSNDLGQYTVSSQTESYLIGTNYLFSKNIGLLTPYANNLNYPVAPVNYEYRYSSSGPIAATWSAGMSNLMFFGPAGADSTDDFYVQSNWEAKYVQWKYRILYRLGGELPALAGSSPTDGNMYKLYTESVIAFPSKSVVTGWISSGMSPVECYFEKGQTNWRNTVYDGMDTFVKVKVTNESIPTYHSLINGSHAFQVEIPMTEIIASADESFEGGLRGYYGLSVEMWEMWKCAIYEYKVPYEIYTVLYAKEDVDTMVYGNMHYSVPNWTNIDPLSNGYVFTGGVIEKPLEDITDNDKQEIQIDTTREELAKRTEELEQLKKEYAESLKMNGSDEDVFELFSNFTSGLRSSSNSFKNVATAVGNVFAFFPQDITGLLYGGIIVMIVIAIVKAIRG